jgi:2-polyprenyl-3-methyl-5-hydroxy-6-metoxy-1,4-benzoquinol methylase
VKHYVEERYYNAEPFCAHQYPLPVVKRYLTAKPNGCRVLDIGCGNGSFTSTWANPHWRVSGIDLSKSGIDSARRSLPNIDFQVGDIAGDLVKVFGAGASDIVISTEVIEHLYDPRAMVRNAFALLRPGGEAILTTPYHGYVKNVALAVTGSCDAHYTALWDGGHIKFWSPRTLTKLLTGAGFADFSWSGAGRIPLLWKSMVIKATRPAFTMA